MLRSRSSRREDELAEDVAYDATVDELGDGPPRVRGRARRLGRAVRCSSYSSRWRRPSGSPSCCTTCSRCRSTTSPRSSVAPPRPLVSWRAGPPPGAAARRARPRPATAQVVEAFLQASRNGDFEGLLALLDPGAVVRADAPPCRWGPRRWSPAPGRGRDVRGPGTGREGGRSSTAAPGAAWQLHGETKVVFGFTVVDGLITEIELLADPEVLGATAGAAGLTVPLLALVLGVAGDEGVHHVLRAHLAARRPRRRARRPGRRRRCCWPGRRARRTTSRPRRPDGSRR